MPSTTPDAGTSAPCAAGQRARDLMTPGVVTISVTARLPQALAALRAHRVTGVLVVGCDGDPVGWVTVESALKLAFAARAVAWAGDALAEPVTAVEPQAPRAEVARRLADPGVSRLLVRERPEWMAEGVIADIDLLHLPETD